MALFVLTPCHVREDRVVPSGEEALKLDWPQVVKLLAPTQSQQALVTLTKMRTSAFVGLMKQPKGPPSNFLFMNENRGNEIGWLLKKQPDWPDRLERVFRVDEAHFDARIEEHSSGEPA